MLQSSEPKQSQLVKVIQRQNVISYKKKPKNIKDFIKSQNNQDQDNISSQSLQSGVYSEDVNKIKRKINNPLPELDKEKKKFLTKNFLNQQIKINNYQQKQVRQHDNLMLKQKNNFLSSENMKLKTKISTLQKQNQKLQKMFEQQSLKLNTPGLVGVQSKDRFRPPENLSTKILIKNFKKQIQQLKKQNANIKSSIKFTTISELQWERDSIMQQSNRLRTMLEEQQSKRISLKMNQQGISHLQQKINSLQQKSNNLTRQNIDLANKVKKYEQNYSKLGKANQNQKNLNKMLFNVRRLLKQKQKQVQQLKDQIKSSSGSIHSIAAISQKNINSQNMLNQRKPSVQRSVTGSKNFEKRVVSKSAQKIQKQNSNVQKNINLQGCQNCKKFKNQIQNLKNKLFEYQHELQNANPLMLTNDPVNKPNTQQIEAVNRFLIFRFKAHHLSRQQSEKYLLNTQNLSDQELQKQMTIEEFVQNLFAEPFVMYNKRYIQVFVINICQITQLSQKSKGQQKIKIDKNFKMAKKKFLENYKKLIPQYVLMTQQKQQQMFLQIAQLVTSYYQHIIAALTNRKNGQGTISQKQLIAFFTQIQLQKQYIDFIITQIILESFDLQKLNYFAFFQIFYLPQQQTKPSSTIQKKNGSSIIDKKKKFQVDHVVKEEDEQYEQSRSYVDAHQKTLSKKQQSNDENQQDQSQNQNQSKFYQKNNDLKDNREENYQQVYQQQNQKINKTLKNQIIYIDKEINKQNNRKDQYQQEVFQEEKINQQMYEQKKSNNVKNVIQKPYEIKDIQDQYVEEFQN